MLELRPKRPVFRNRFVPDPLPERPFDAVRQDRAARAALDALGKPGAWWHSPVSLGPFAHGQLKSALAEITHPPTIVARCGCGYRLVKWQLDPTRGTVFPVARPNRDTTPGWGGLAWLDKANTGKGRVTTGASAHDGLATQNYKCPKCRRNVPVSAERRLKLFLQAMVAGRRETWI